MDDSQHDRVDLIYFEPQAAALCGVHALNALLQGPYFSEIDLAQIAQELDELEHKLMLESGMESADYLKFVAEESGNVADHGMFSIQVLSKALEVWGLSAVPINNPEAAVAKAEPQHQQAFICNLREHWFTVRQLWGQWWNLNSVFAAPEPLSAFYLSAFLGSLQEQGYSIFVIRGQLPMEPHPDCKAREGPGRWFTPEEAREAHEQSKALKQQGFLQAAYKGVLGKASALGNMVRLKTSGSKRSHQDGEDNDDLEGGDDLDLARALAASLAEHDGPGPSSQAQRRGVGDAARAASAAGSDDDADLAAAIAASLAGHPQQAQQQTQQQAQQQAQHGGAISMEDDEDSDLAAAIHASLQQHGGHAQRVQREETQQQEGVGAGRAGPAAAGGSGEAEPDPAAAAAAADPAAAAAAAAQPAAAAAGAASLLVLPELGPEPDAGEEGVIEVGLRLPDGSRQTRRFLAAQHTVGHLVALAAAHGLDASMVRLVQRFPRRVFEDLSQPLKEAGIGNKEMLNVDLC